MSSRFATLPAQPKITVLMPCLNEAATLEHCISRAKILLNKLNLPGEIIVADNGSSDASREIALLAGAIVVAVDRRGYGAAYMGGLDAATGDIIVMGDADNSYHFDEAENLVAAIRAGADIVIGNRFLGGIEPGAMPSLNRYLGNPILSLLARILFHSPVRDFHCGLRAARREALLALPLITTGMEWATEEIVKAQYAGYRIEEVPVKLYPDGRDRASHLRPWRDGWRHLRFMLLHAPVWLFSLPGLALSTFGLIVGFLVWWRPFTLMGVTFDIHTLLICAFMLMAGIQIIYTGVFARLYAVKVGLMPLPPKNKFSNLPKLSLEFMLFLSAILGVFGLILIGSTFYSWSLVNYQGLNVADTFRQLIPGVALTMIGLQSGFAAFMVSVLQLEVKR